MFLAVDQGVLDKVVWVSTLDLVYPFSSPTDIHPTNKEVVGSRMAWQILKVEYQHPEAAFATFPTYQQLGPVAMTGQTITVTVELNGCAAGCVLRPATLPPGVAANLTEAFAIEAGNVWYPATAAMGNDGQSVELTVTLPAGASTEVSATRYGRCEYPLAALFNSFDDAGHGWPAAPWCYRWKERTACYVAETVVEAAQPAFVVEDDVPRY